jgi:hypothetical protein
MKKRHFVLVIVLILLGLFIAFSAAAHPYDEPLTFRKHLTDDGRVIWSNIPKACFSKGLLTCEGLHPIYGMSVKMKSAEDTKTKKVRPVSTTKKAKSDSTTQNATTSDDLAVPTPGPAWKLSLSGNKCHDKESQYYEQTKEFDGFTSKRECDAVAKAKARRPRTKKNY